MLGCWTCIGDWKEWGYVYEQSSDGYMRFLEISRGGVDVLGDGVVVTHQKSVWNGD